MSVIEAGRSIDQAQVRFLKAAVRRRFGFGPGEEEPADPETLKDVAALYDMARRNKLVLLLGADLLKSVAPADRNVIGALIETYRARTFGLNARVVADTLSVAKTLLSRNIPFVVLKGVAQQKVLYGEFFAKPVGDIDILVGPARYADVRAILRSYGFEVAGRCRSLWWRMFLGEQHLVRAGAAPATVDLHHRLQQPGSPSPLDLPDFIARHELVDVAGFNLPVISRADLPIITSISIVKALFNREACGGYVCDFIAGVKDLSRLELQTLLRRAERQGLSGTLLLGFRAASVLAGTGLGSSEVRTDAMLASTADHDLELMLLSPWESTIVWPQRRDVLRDLCDRKLLRFLGEASWAGIADISRRLLEPREDLAAQVPQ